MLIYPHYRCIVSTEGENKENLIIIIIIIIIIIYFSLIDYTIFKRELCNYMRVNIRLEKNRRVHKSTMTVPREDWTSQ